MATGFSVAELAPFRGGRGALRFGLGTLPEALWRDTGPSRAARAAAKAPVFAGAPDSLMVRPEAAAAIAELAVLLGVPDGDLRDCALAAYEDWLLLLPQDAAHVLVAGALAFPTDWQLAAKLGKPLAAIHAPIPTYAEKLSAGVDHVFRALAPGRLLMRANWNVLESDDLRYLPTLPAMARFGHVTADNAGAALFVRVERQTLRRLPDSGGVVFGIGVYIEALAALPAPLVQDLVRAVASLPPAEALRRGTPAYAAALTTYAAAL